LSRADRNPEATASPAPEGVRPPAAELDEHRVLFFLSLVGGLALLALALLLLSPLAPSAVDNVAISREILVLDPGEVRPEPLERFLYTTGVLLAPLCFFMTSWGARRLAVSARGAARRIAPVLAWLSAPLVLLLVFAAGFAEFAAGVAEGRISVRSCLPGGFLPAIVAIFIGAAVVATDRRRVQAARGLKAALIAIAAFLLLAVFSFGIIGVEHIRKIPFFLVSFNAFFHSVVQVYLGKALLIDFSNQYGLYPHFLEPFFQVFGLSVYSFTIVMAGLNVLSFAGFYRFVAAQTRDELLALLALATMLYFGYVSSKLAIPDIYFQYHPLRVLFPALALPLAARYAGAPSPLLGAGFAALGAAAVLWNPDSGMGVLAAALSLPCYDALARRRFASIPARLLCGMTAAAAVIAILFVAMRLRYGHFPHVAQFLAAAKAFYALGVSMRPMPRFGLWVPVVAVYAIALLRAMTALVDGSEAVRPRLYFCLSVMGLGAFTYYQGRSVFGNLLATSYPAVIVLALLADDLRRTARPCRKLPDLILAGTVAALLAFSAPALLAVSPAWAQMLSERVRTARGGGAPGVMADVAFVHEQLRPGEEVVVISYLSGLYHLASRTTNPLDVPGQSELCFRKDFDEQHNYALEHRGKVLLDTATLVPRAVNAFTLQAPSVIRNPYGTLILLGAR
jgi:hypothetical protein